MVFTRLVTTNLKHPGTLVTHLGPCTAFVSERNRALKTALASDAVRLALTGRHPVGRNPSDLAKLAVQGATELGASLVGDNHGDRDGNACPSASFLMKIARGKAKRPVHRVDGIGGDPGGTSSDASSDPSSSLLPTLHLRDLAAMGSAKTREAVFARWGAGGAAEPVGLTEAQRALWDEAKAAVGGPGTDPATLLSALAGRFRGRKMELGRRIKSLERGLAEKAPEAAGAERIEELRARLREARRREVQKATREAAEAERLDAARRELEEAGRAVAELEARQSELEARRSELVGPEAEAAMALVEPLRALLRAGVEVCPCCGRDGARAAMEDRIGQLERACKALEEQVRSIDEELAATRQGLGEARYAAAAARARIERSQERPSAAPNEASSETPGEASDDVASLEAELASLEEAAAARRAYEHDVAAIRRLSEEQRTVALLEKEAGRLLLELLGRTRARGEEAVNRFMPPGYEARLVVSGTNVCHWAVVGADGRPHGPGAMSGSEEALLLVALALAWPPDGAPRYVVLDDRDLGLLSRETLRATLERLRGLQAEGVVAQCFVAWSRPDEVAGLSGWTVVQTDEIQIGEAQA